MPRPGRQPLWTWLCAGHDADQPSSPDSTTIVITGPNHDCHHRIRPRLSSPVTTEDYQPRKAQRRRSEHSDRARSAFFEQLARRIRQLRCPTNRPPTLGIKNGHKNSHYYGRHTGFSTNGHKNSHYYGRHTGFSTNGHKKDGLYGQCRLHDAHIHKKEFFYGHAIGL